MYLGDIPESFRSHMIRLGSVPYAGAAPTNLREIRVWAKSDTRPLTTMHLDLGITDHAFTATDCGTTWTIDGIPGVSVNCTTSGASGNVSAISAYALGLGVHLTATNATLYKPNNHEFDHITSGFIIILMLMYFGTWLMWTRDLPTEITSEARRSATWVRVANHYIPINCAILLMVMSRNMWAAIRHGHGMYNIETIDMIGLAHLQVYIKAYAYGFTPLVVGSSLMVLAYGNNVHRPVSTNTEIDPARLFTWGTTMLGSWDLLHRVWLFVAAQAAAVTVVVLFWVYAMENTTSGVLGALYTSLVLLYWSSSARLQWMLRHRYAALRVHDGVLLLYLSWSVRVLVLMSISANTPYDIGGVFAVQFHTFISIGSGLLVAITTGRTAGMMDRLAGIEALLLFSIVAVFALSFSVLFGLGSLYGSTGALRNQPTDVALCATCFTWFAVVVGFCHEWRRRR